jgi:hypothetical protein
MGPGTTRARALIAGIPAQQPRTVARQDELYAISPPPVLLGLARGVVQTQLCPPRYAAPYRLGVASPGLSDEVVCAMVLRVQLSKRAIACALRVTLNERTLWGMGATHRGGR